mmetsp:Transcript_24689/g.78034  ORF Transcript_24689/g.78034 Transcript_24689/m.78034 type:complete len:306 (+) Transcript_24689:1090-2007(+)
MRGHRRMRARKRRVLGGRRRERADGRMREHRGGLRVRGVQLGVLHGGIPRGWHLLLPRQRLRCGKRRLRPPHQLYGPRARGLQLRPVPRPGILPGRRLLRLRGDRRLPVAAGGPLLPGRGVLGRGPPAGGLPVRGLPPGDGGRRHQLHRGRLVQRSRGVPLRRGGGLRPHHPVHGHPRARGRLPVRGVRPRVQGRRHLAGLRRGGLRAHERVRALPVLHGGELQGRARAQDGIHLRGRHGGRQQPVPRGLRGGRTGRGPSRQRLRGYRRVRLQPVLGGQRHRASLPLHQHGRRRGVRRLPARVPR